MSIEKISEGRLDVGEINILQRQLYTVLGISEDQNRLLKFISKFSGAIRDTAENSIEIRELIGKRQFLTAAQKIIEELNLEEEVKNLDDEQRHLEAA